MRHRSVSRLWSSSPYPPPHHAGERDGPDHPWDNAEILRQLSTAQTQIAEKVEYIQLVVKVNREMIKSVEERDTTIAELTAKLARAEKVVEAAGQVHLKWSNIDPFTSQMFGLRDALKSYREGSGK